MQMGQPRNKAISDSDVCMSVGIKAVSNPIVRILQHENQALSNPIAPAYLDRERLRDGDGDLM